MSSENLIIHSAHMKYILIYWNIAHELKAQELKLKTSELVFDHVVWTKVYITRWVAMLLRKARITVSIISLILQASSGRVVASDGT